MGCILLGVEVGLLFGIALSVLYILFLWARPKTIVKIEMVFLIENLKKFSDLMLYDFSTIIRTSFEFVLMVDCCFLALII